MAPRPLEVRSTTRVLRPDFQLTIDVAELVSPAYEFSPCRGAASASTIRMNGQQSAELSIEMHERAILGLKARRLDLTNEHRVLTDRELVDDLAIEHGKCIDQGRSAACQVDPMC